MRLHSLLHPVAVMVSIPIVKRSIRVLWDNITYVGPDRFNMPESPRWLLARGRIQALQELIQRIATRNNITLPDNYQDTLQAPENADANVSILDLFNTEYRNRTLTMTIIWFSLVLLYFGITLHMNALGGNIFTNTVSTGRRWTEPAAVA